MDRTHIGARSNLSPGIRLVSAPLLGGPRLHLRLLEHGDARFCGSGVRSFREPVELGERITLRRATGKTRQMVAQVLDVIPVLYELPACQFLGLAYFLRGES